MNVSSLIGQMKNSNFGTDKPLNTKRFKKPYLETSQNCIIPWRWRNTGQYYDSIFHLKLDKGAKMFENESDDDERLISREHKGTVALKSENHKNEKPS